MNKIKKQVKGITLVVLVVTIIVLLILAGVTINLIMGNNGLFNRAEIGANEYNKKEATEKINLKITSVQIKVYSESERMPTLQEIADDFCEDNEIQYVELESKKTANIGKITVGEAKSIFTKLKNYPYEFEIDSSLKLASINGIKIGNIEENNTVSNKVLLWSGLANEARKEHEFNIKNEETGEKYKYTDFSYLLVCYCGGSENLRSGTMLIPTDAILGSEHQWEIDGYYQRYCIFQIYENSFYVTSINGDIKLMITAVYGIK